MTATDLDLDALLDALQARALERANAVELVNVAGQPVGPDLRASTGRLQVNPGDIIASVWGNTTYDQTVEVFDTAAARDSQWPTPKDGAVSYTVDTGTLWVRRAGAWASFGAPSDTAWTAVSGFTNGWSANGTFPPAYTMLNRIVYLRGAIAAGTANASAFTLPVGYRPTLGTIFAVTNGAGAVMQVTVQPAGTVTPLTAATAWLSGVTFPLT